MHLFVDSCFWPSVCLPVLLGFLFLASRALLVCFHGENLLSFPCSVHQLLLTVSASKTEDKALSRGFLHHQWNRGMKMQQLISQGILALCFLSDTAKTAAMVTRMRSVPLPQLSEQRELTISISRWSLVFQAEATQSFLGKTQPWAQWCTSCLSAETSTPVPPCVEWV